MCIFCFFSFEFRSRKRRPSFTQDERDLYLNSINDDDPMDECNAALVLMSLSCSPHSPRVGCDTLGSSPGSSSASWSTGSSSPPLSDDNLPPTTEYKYENRCANSLSTSDEGIAMDYNEDMPRKRRVSIDAISLFLNLRHVYIIDS
jgi:hypothetical protein